MVARRQGATIAIVAKFKAARGKKRTPQIPQGGMACVVVVIAGIFLVMVFLFYVLKNANG